MSDAPGKLADFPLVAGQVHGLRAVPELIENLTADHLLAERAFEADWLRVERLGRDVAPVIPPTSNQGFAADFGKET